ncbi:hypothetical protein F2Q68_00024776 [Brassica cretica]|uniref:RNase H type-1 domain-containing protein n=1 Tax=Brassica cretica TaxID=69181 RepID=A0A8S9II30_BRACR|nr:hypothetical protein F2Q68_00024776 [Brassica cretica]
MGVEKVGLQGCRKSLSPLHAEMEGLIWAMFCLREFHCTAIHMETDCSDLVEMLDNHADWPAFASELVSFRLLKDGFSDFSISRIPRTRNLRADSLAKEARISGFSYLDLDMEVFQIWKNLGYKTSRRLQGRLPDDFKEVFQTTSRKSSDGVFNQMVFIFHLDMHFVCFSDMGLIYMISKSISNFGRLMGSLFGSLLKYNALEDFKVFQTTSWKSSDGVFFHIKWSLSLSL